MVSLGPGGVALLAAAAAAAGAVNAIAGGGSLVSFPALLLVGYPAVTANITNAVGLVPGYLGGVVAYAPELSGQGARMRRLAPVSIAGALAGAALLVAGPESAFQRVVPWLIIGSCLLLLAQPRLRDAVLRRRDPGRPGVPGGLLAAQLVTAVYGAYFGAGLGVIMLATMGALLHDTLQRVNALKGALSVVISLVSVACFIATGRVAWAAAAAMAPASLAGGVAGVHLARRLDERSLRLAIVALGLAVGIRLAV